ncbi:hypothetical protein PseudUWO311_12550 [Pseudanabaena sp. UWO311]|uniref:hypothetical protein n=1 Tax=Pseudanabaena sp. UWO311 TaxID=2487337 RepID=UPI001159C571|nr:hypothetical protein [Pseudanabaena sp. UWO311]TYQ26349.1 hypothetical protein PseudUWO311_12550 [Pseudanabaena sp. UWO311]
MLFSSLNQVRLIAINTIFGTEKAITVLGKTFVDHKVCNSLNEAIAECRSDLELGIAILITCDADKFSVWVSIPEEVILQPI